MKKPYLSRKEILSCAEIFRTCAHPARLKMVELLMKKPMYVNEVMNRTKLSQAETSHHLGMLLKIGVLKNERDGKKVFYSVNEEKLDIILKAVETVLT
jgi:DNA-binding transcriptional ArsR family regulator